MNLRQFRLYPVGKEDEGRRLETVARRLFAEVPLSALHRALRRGFIRVNHKKKAGGYRLEAGDCLEVISQFSPSLPPRFKVSLDPSWIVCENEHLLVINKPSGLLVHGADDSLESRVKGYLASTLPSSLAFTPAPLHRLDRNSSGLIVCSRSLTGARLFSQLLREGHLKKEYLAIVDGKVENAFTWVDSLSRDKTRRRSYLSPEGKKAQTSLSPLFTHQKHSLVLLSLRSGRTHQIRAQCASHGFPLAGDKKYGGRQGPFFLHAHSISLSKYHPLLKFKRLTAPPPGHIESAMEFYFGREVSQIRKSIRLLGSLSSGNS